VVVVAALTLATAHAIGPDLRGTWTSGFDAWCAS